MLMEINKMQLLIKLQGQWLLNKTWCNLGIIFITTTTAIS